MVLRACNEKSVDEGRRIRSNYVLNGAALFNATIPELRPHLIPICNGYQV